MTKNVVQMPGTVRVDQEPPGTEAEVSYGNLASEAKAHRVAEATQEPIRIQVQLPDPPRPSFVAVSLWLIGCVALGWFLGSLIT